MSALIIEQSPEYNGKLVMFLVGIHSIRVAHGWSVDTHRHPSLFEMNLVIEGAQVLRHNRRRLVLAEGDIALLNPNTPHSAQAGSDRELRLFCLHLSTNNPLLTHALCAGNRSRVHYPRNTPLNEAILPCLQGMMKLCENRPLSLRNELELQEHGIRLLSALLNGLSPPQTAESASAYKFEQTQAMIEMLDAHFNQLRNDPGGRSDGRDPIVQTMADRIGMSVSNCNKVFKSCLGLSPRQYWSTLVMEEAKRMLVGSTIPVNEIATAIGYRNPAVFSQQFKRWTGTSPLGYRKRKGG